MLNHEQQEAIGSLREKGHYDRILRLVLEQYKKMGRFGGTVQLTGSTEAERQILGTLDHQLYTASVCRFRVAGFLKQCLLVGRLAGISPEEFFKDYENRNHIVTKQELREEKLRRRQAFFDGLGSEFSGTRSGQWLSVMLEDKVFGYSVVIREYNRDKGSLKEILTNVMKALNAVDLSCRNYLPLTLFAVNITRDPHYFDLSATASRIFLHGICFLLDKPFPKGIEEVNELFYCCGLVRDPVFNNTAVYGLILPGHEGVEGFNKRKEFFYLSLEAVINAPVITAQGGAAFVFENPVVFHQVMGNVRDSGASLICTGGQLNLSAILLLDKLAEQEVRIYYSGDFDPEGLKIADKLKLRYGEELLLWRLAPDDYEGCLSHISLEGKLGKLNSIQTPELLATAARMRQVKRAGYQELLIDRYSEDILSNLP